MGAETVDRDDPGWPARTVTGGGGKLVEVGGGDVTYGLTLHCDITLSNNLEINWPGNKWHLDKPISFADCQDNIWTPKPPAAPFDTFNGWGLGSLNGVPGYRVDFTFIDDGEGPTSRRITTILAGTDHSEVGCRRGDPGLHWAVIHFLVPRGQEFGIAEFLESWTAELAGRFRYLHYEDLARCRSLPVSTYILAALDQLTPHGRRLVGEIEAQLRAAGLPVLNSCIATLDRLDLLVALYREGYNQHSAARAVGPVGGLRFPVFLREEHQHTGALSSLIHTAEELEAQLARAIVRGYPLSELLVVEYCDTADPEGFYRKYAAHMIGGEIVPQFMDYGADWMLKHSENRFSPSMLVAELEYVRANPHREELRKIFALAGVQYGRIDYAVKDGRVETWEINSNATLARYPDLPEPLETLRRATIEHFAGGFRSAVRQIDCPVPSRPVEIQLGAELRQARHRVIRPQRPGRISLSLSRLVRPWRSQISRAVASLAPVILTLAGRLRR